MKRDAGFTLIEMMVAIALAAVVLTTIYGIFTTVSRARAIAGQGSESSHLARILFERLGRELRGAWQPETGDIFFSAGPDRDGRPELRFATASVTLESSGSGGIATLRYRTEPAAEIREGMLTLLRSEAPYHQRARLDDLAGYPLCRTVRNLRWRFYGPDGWRDDWQATERNSLPQLVEVTLTLGEGREESEYRAIFDLPETGERR